MRRKKQTTRPVPTLLELILSGRRGEAWIHPLPVHVIIDSWQLPSEHSLPLRSRRFR